MYTSTFCKKINVNVFNVSSLASLILCIVIKIFTKLSEHK